MYIGTRQDLVGHRWRCETKERTVHISINCMWRVLRLTKQQLHHNYVHTCVYRVGKTWYFIDNTFNRHYVVSFLYSITSHQSVIAILLTYIWFVLHVAINFHKMSAIRRQKDVFLRLWHPYRHVNDDNGGNQFFFRLFHSSDKRCCTFLLFTLYTIVSIYNLPSCESFPRCESFQERSYLNMCILL